MSKIVIYLQYYIDFQKTALKNLNRYTLFASDKDPDHLEIRETIRAINGVMAGPKGTIIRGQSEVIQILKVDFKSKRFRKEITEKANSDTETYIYNNYQTKN